MSTEPPSDCGCATVYVGMKPIGAREWRPGCPVHPDPPTRAIEPPSDSEDECLTCTEPGSGVEGECPHGRRACGHHCNHVWDQDICHWCGAEVNEDGDLVPNFAPMERETTHA